MVCNGARNDFLKNENEQNVSSYFLVGEENFVDSDSCRNFSIKFLGPKNSWSELLKVFYVCKKSWQNKIKECLGCTVYCKKECQMIRNSSTLDTSQCTQRVHLVNLWSLGKLPTKCCQCTLGNLSDSSGFVLLFKVVANLDDWFWTC